jgi:integrase
MAIYKRGKIYWYKFVWNGELIRESTKQGNDKVARQMEAAHRTSLAKGEVGIREKRVVPTLAEFISTRFEPWAKASFEHSSPKTWQGWYRPNLKIISEYKRLGNQPICDITSEHVSEFAAQRQATKTEASANRPAKTLEVSSVNSSLRVLRRVLRIAVEWGVLSSAPKIKLIRGEKHRERVISPTDEAKYLAAAPEPLASVATVLCDTGLRPEECYRLRWESITWANGRHGTLMVTHGKTAAARRVLPMSQRVSIVLQTLWKRAGEPQDGWVFTAPTRSGHIEPSSLKKQHVRAFRVVNDEAKKCDQQPINPWVLYSFRHTFLTRLGESGCDTWTLARIAGHSTIAMSSRYVHPSAERMLDAVYNLGGHKFGHSPEKQLPDGRSDSDANATEPKG